MIQRIQSFYLVLAVCAMALCFMFPVVTCHVDGGSAEGQPATSAMPVQIEGKMYLVDRADAGVSMQIDGKAETLPQKKFVSTWPLVVTAALAGLLALVSIFLFANRMRQVRVVAFAFLINVAYLFIVFISTYDTFTDHVTQMAEAMGCAVSCHYSIGTWMAVVSLLLLFLAQRAIRRDEAKVRAADRLR